MKIKIIKEKKGNSQYDIYDFDEIRTRKASQDELRQYRELFNKIVLDNLRDSSYLLSDLLNCEDGDDHGIDHFFKFLECVRVIEKSRKNIIITNISLSVLRSLRKYLSSRKIKFHHNMTEYLFGVLSEYFLFILRSLKTLIFDFLIALYAKIKLSNKLDEAVKEVFVSYFDDRSITVHGLLSDPFFYPVQTYLKKNNVPFAVINILINNNSLLKAFKYINQIKKTGDLNVLTLYNLMPIYGPLICFIGQIKSKVRIDDDIYFNGLSVGDFLNERLRDEFLKRHVQYNLLRMYIRTLLNFSFIRRIYYPFENFVWEKFLCLEKTNKNSTAELVGFQHTSFSMKLQQHFPIVSDKTINMCPTRILTTGEITRDVLLTYGKYPDDLIHIGCALRHEYIFEALSSELTDHKLTGQIAFAFSFDKAKYDYILNKIISIFGDKELNLVLKFHPLNKDYLPEMRNLPGNITNGTHIPWKDLMTNIDLLLYEGNSVSVDALAYNIPAVYFPFTGDVYDTNQLYGYEFDFGVADNEITYYAQVKHLMEKNLRNDTKLREYNKEYVIRYFNPVTADGIKKFVDQF